MYASKGAIRVSINLTASHQEKTEKKWKEETTTTLNVPIKVGPVLMKSSVHALTRKYFATGISAETAVKNTFPYRLLLPHCLISIQWVWPVFISITTSRQNYRIQPSETNLLVSADS